MTVITRRMNARINFFAMVGGQNDYGEVLQPRKHRVWSCWAEVTKTSLSDFRKASGKTEGIDNLTNVRDTKIFLIRYLPEIPFDNSMMVEFNGLDYKIEAIEVDHATKDMIMVKGVRVT